MNMSDHSFDVEWRYVVPPRNETRITISQRQDGPFREDVVGGEGHYHVSVEVYWRGQWVHREGSSSGAYSSWQEAFLAAIAKWQEECTK